MKEYWLRIDQEERGLLQNGLLLMIEMIGDPGGRIAKLIARLQAAGSGAGE